MREIIALMIIGIVMFSGCVAEEPAKEPEVLETSEQPEEPREEERENGVPGIIEVPDEEEIIEQKRTSGRATSQNDCSTLSPNCETCLAKEGCQWCKTTNACYYEGIVPTISSCDPNDWAENENQCAGPPGGASCEEQTTCPACLSGSGCKWCIQGAICASESSSDECFGGWLSESYQCAYASR